MRISVKIMIFATFDVFAADNENFDEVMIFITFEVFAADNENLC